MTNEFIVSTEEIVALDEARFLAEGGQELRFGALNGGTVQLHAIGSRAAICGLARTIISHRTASR